MEKPSSEISRVKSDEICVQCICYDTSTLSNPSPFYSP